MGNSQSYHESTSLISYSMNERNVGARLNRIVTYKKLGSISKAALKCGIPRSTLYRWILRYKEVLRNLLHLKINCRAV